MTPYQTPEQTRLILPVIPGGRGFPKGFGFLDGRVLYSESYRRLGLEELHMVCATLGILGLGNGDIAAKLDVKPGTVSEAFGTLYSKLRLHASTATRTPLLRSCLTEGVMYVDKFAPKDAFPVPKKVAPFMDSLSHGQNYRQIAAEHDCSKGHVTRQFGALALETGIPPGELTVAAGILTGHIDQEGFAALAELVEGQSDT